MPGEPPPAKGPGHGHGYDLVARGSRGKAPLGTAIFIGLRALDPLLQRQLLLHSPLPHLARLLGLSPPAAPPTGGLPLAGTGLAPYQSLVWAYSIGSAAKHIFWALFLGNEPISPAAAAIIAVFNTLNNTLNTLAYDLAGENPTYFEPWSVYAGSALFFTGVLTETVGEIQRKRFKDRPENEGKIYRGGIFSVVRHASYLGYSLWRGGYAMACGGPLWGAAVMSFFLWDFANRAIPILDEYMANKYGEQWMKMKRDVPYALIPGVW
ncbi:hypothetical protein HRR83_009022 [Exophiala dermatitidis]|uniref:Uncharacterized protein n=2 Tax=Exophiala dermatitidis TaxID=5970 RepID=H6CC27_EXODN|nr:uncharacterized protein HMPREF1120_09259 [Exophiala dermatitidis NIH/UT8656]KAJ4502599.1 hypothetical protein HRR75_008327 [Exophiala dermatitidis]EHY61325.1 hypothetical protein HMPREF1120_09259 [Exophiala dermatitidis NIH/UT8656]KAJ4503441.1 hypothetical protein HRR73_009066 [Exophiala dermatitidis]KAJ4504043.1 hypothetical protein HRR74_009064 [Exophiala dermatitidis]KAJ4528970.1 hypothetical protein HRR76_009583 [Exophiala dermatitidis]